MKAGHAADNSRASVVVFVEKTGAIREMRAATAELARQIEQEAAAPPNARLRCIVEGGENGEERPVLYCEIKDGKHYRPIAKRLSGENWINLEPSYAVTDSAPGSDYSTICIEHTPVGAH
jgi:hypothetical protein